MTDTGAASTGFGSGCAGTGVGLTGNGGGLAEIRCVWAGTDKMGGALFAMGAGVAPRTNGWDNDGGGLATDESRTTTRPAAFFFGAPTGRKGAGCPAPVPLAEGSGGLGAPSGTDGLSAIILSVRVNAKNRDFKAGQLACLQ